MIHMRKRFIIYENLSKFIRPRPYKTFAINNKNNIILYNLYIILEMNTIHLQQKQPMVNDVIMTKKRPPKFDRII